MRTVEAGASDSDLIALLSEWSDLMAAGDFAAAADFLHQPSEESGAETWTADSLKTYIQNYGSWDERTGQDRMRVTSTAEAAQRAPAPHEVFSYKDRPPDIEFALPLNGEWSDLTAMIDVVEVDGRWAFVLYDLHVL
jgi:hypothetical protein